MRKRRRRRVFVATTTVLACLSTATTSLSHIMFTTLPFVAQQLQVVSNYLNWRQVERLQLVYNYSCQAGSYYRSYYRCTLETYYNILPLLRAPRPDRLVDWHDVKDYLIDNLIKAHKNDEYKVPSKMMEAYYNTFSELLLPATTDGEGDDSESDLLHHLGG